MGTTSSASFAAAPASLTHVLVDLTDELILLFSREGGSYRCVGANAAWRDATRFEGDVVASRPAELLTPESAVRLADAPDPSAGTVRFDDVLDTGDRRVALAVAITAFEHLDTAYLLWRAHDVTERRRDDEAAARVQRELERSNEDLAAFATVASHDLQEPLRMVSAYVELLARRYRGQLDEQADTYIGFAVDGAQRMRALIDALLEYARLRTSEPTPQRVDLEALTRDVLEGLRPTIDRAGATVSVGSLPSLYGDAGELARLLHNLVTNALKFVTVAPAIDISAEVVDDRLRLIVEDNGLGIPEDRREDVFDMFTRLHPRSAYPGTGMGLALCRAIVERHGGDIWAESSISGGARLVSEFPPRQPQEQPA